MTESRENNASESELPDVPQVVNKSKKKKRPLKRKFHGNRFTVAKKNKDSTGISDGSSVSGHGGSGELHGTSSNDLASNKRTSFERRLASSKQFDDATGSKQLGDSSGPERDSDSDDSVSLHSDSVSLHSDSDCDSDLICDSDNDTNDIDMESEATGFRIIDIHILKQLFLKTCCCQSCQSKAGLELKELCRMGLSIKLLIFCVNCDFEYECWSSNLADHADGAYKTYEVNRRAVLATTSIGKGYAGLRKFCGTMNMPKPMTKNTFEQNAKSCGKIINNMADRNMKHAAKAAVKATGSNKLTYSNG